MTAIRSWSDNEVQTEMKRRFRLSFLLLAGILLVAAGLIGLTTVPDLMQYAFLPPASSQTAVQADTESRSAADADYMQEDADYTQSSSGTTESEQSKAPLLDQYDEAMKGMGEAFPQMTVHSIRNNVRLQTDEKTGRDDEQKENPPVISLYATGPFWPEVYVPKMVSGRPLGRMDAEKNSKVIVLDRETAFYYFEEKDPIGQTIRIGENEENEFEVVGVAEHCRRIGELGEHAAWVPLDQGTGSEIMVLSTRADSDSLATLFETEAKTRFGSGTMTNLKKEKFRALLPLLLIVVTVMIWLLKRWFGWVIGYAKIQMEKVKAESKRRYPIQLLPYAAGQLLPAALLIALTIAACFGVAVLALQPIGVFSEWIPETLGEYTAWIARFWNLAGIAAAPVTFKTPEMAEVQFWSNLILWGTMLILLRAAKNTLTGFIKKKED